MTVFFKIEQIDVEGNTAYADDVLIQSSGIEKGDNLIRLRAKKIAQSLHDQYPYLESVSVRRSLPDSVMIRVTVAEKAAALRDGNGRYLILSREGRVLETDLAQCPDGMIPVDGFSVEGLSAGGFLSEEEQSRFASLLEIEDALSQYGMQSMIRVIDVSDLFDIWMLYDGRLAVKLGSTSELDYKVRFAQATIADDVTSATVGTLDVSERPTARLREYDIYEEDTWMFADDLREEYERRIVKEVPAVTTDSDEEESAPEISAPADSGEESGSEIPAPADDEDEEETDDRADDADDSSESED
jgi:hypothetical protein